MKRFYIEGVEVSQQEFEREVYDAIQNMQFSTNEEENWALQDQAVENVIYDCNHGEYDYLLDGKEFQSKEE